MFDFRRGLHRIGFVLLGLWLSFWTLFLSIVAYHAATSPPQIRPDPLNPHPTSWGAGALLLAAYIILPPLIVYGLAKLLGWIGRGFQRPKVTYYAPPR